MEPTLLERAFKLIANPPRLSDYEGDGGVHPNDFRGVVDRWIKDYETAKNAEARNRQELIDETK